MDGGTGKNEFERVLMSKLINITNAIQCPLNKNSTG